MKNKKTIFLSIIIPAYNEAHRLPKTLEYTYKYLAKQSYNWEILVVNDGSTDQTAPIVQKLTKQIPQLKLINNTINQGKGAVVKQGILKARGKWRLFMDADNSTRIEEVEKLFVYKNNFAVIIGSRHLKKGSIKTPPPWYRAIISYLSNLLIQLLVAPGIKDTQCGFKLFRADAAEKIFPLQTVKGWSFDIEIIGLARKLHLPIKEVAINWYNSPESKVRAIRALFNSLIELFKIWQRLKKIK